MPVILPQIRLCCQIILAMQVLTVELLEHLASSVSSNHQEPLFLKKIFLMMDAIIDSH